MTTLPAFDLHRPATVDEAGRLLEELGEDAVVYSGGTELLLVMKLGLADYGHLVDVKRIDELRRLDAADGVLEVGAAVTHREVERSATVRGRWDALATMERDVGNLRVRTMGTIGGNLCFADPHSDPATFLFAAGGSVVCRRAGGPPRELPIESFVKGPYETALEPGELLTAVRVPAPPERAGIAHEKIAFHERPAATVSCVALADGGALADVRLAVGSVGNRPFRASDAEAALQGAAVEALEGPLAAAAEAAAAQANAVEDANGSVEYKRQLVRVLTGRCVRSAVRRAG